MQMQNCKLGEKKVYIEF